ncbi:ABC transporter substrate-binding protein [Bacilliculturomica massiliensis]|uniref:ABC transporter substrate-binding protein n=1 Tax=Bacilliculturomica massiliensis TaxID=1917867 RepID=UPI0010305AD0|nr:ABC transporter substrate-binding protein [Bacilliculturomica massiliensis]
MKKSLALLMAAVLALSMAGCSGSGDTGDSGEAKTKIVVAVTAEILSLDPQVNSSTPGETVKDTIFEGLVKADEFNEVHPSLAESWSVSDDGLEWTFKLRQGVKFHDGEEFKAADVKATLERYLTNEGSTRAYLYNNIKEVQILDDYTVKIVTNTVQANLLNVLAYGGGGIMSAKSLERSNDEIAASPVGTGPFKLKEVVTGESATVEKFDDYWGEGSDLTEIKFLTVTEASTRVNMLETGEVDYITGVTKEDIARFEGNEKFTVQYADSNRVAHLGFNMTKTPFDNKLVRQAMNYAVDREAIVEGVLGGMGTVARSVLAETTYGFSDAGDMYTYDPAKAKELLKQAGYPDGFDATVVTCDGRYFKDKATVMAVTSQLAEVGINLKVDVYDWASYLDLVKTAWDDNNTVEMYFFGWESGTGEASYLFNSLFTKKNWAPVGWNTMFYENDEFEKLNDLSYSCTDDTERLAEYAQMQKIVMDDAPWMPLFVFQQVAVYRSDLSGITLLPIEFPRFTECKIK